MGRVSKVEGTACAQDTLGKFKLSSIAGEKCGSRLRRAEQLVEEK